MSATKDSALMADTLTALRQGTMRVTVKQLQAVVPIENPYLRIRVAGKDRCTAISDSPHGDWEESFEFTISFHTQMFSTLQIDLYQANVFVIDRFVGRAEMRISKLNQLPSSFTTWMELRSERVPSLLEENVQHLDGKSGQSSLAALQVHIEYSFQSLQDISPDRTAELLSKRHQDHVSVHHTRSDNNSSDINTHNNDNSNKVNDDGGDSNNNNDNDKNDRTNKNLTEDLSTLVSTVNHLLTAIKVAPHTRETFINVLSMMNAFNQGFEHITRVQWLWAILLLDRYFTTVNLPRKSDIVQDRWFFANALHFKKYAMAAYGWRGLTFFRRGASFWSGFSATADRVTALAYLSHLKDEDLLAYEFRSSQVFQPSYFIVHDKKERAIVLTLRGTMSATDTITDLVCDYTILGQSGHLVHRGVKVASDFLLGNVYPILVNYLKEHDATNLMIVGHSLGAGIAAVFTISLFEYKFVEDMNSKLGREITVKCFAFSPPPVVDLSLAKRYEKVIDTFVFENDLVCRLSYGSVLDLRCLMIAAIQLVSNHHLEILKLFNPLSKNANEPTLQAMFNKLENVRKKLSVDQSNPKLYIPGAIYHIRKENTTANSLFSSSQQSIVSGTSHGDGDSLTNQANDNSNSGSPSKLMNNLGLSNLFGVLSFPLAPRVSSGINSTSVLTSPVYVTEDVKEEDKTVNHPMLSQQPTDYSVSSTTTTTAERSQVQQQELAVTTMSSVPVIVDEPITTPETLNTPYIIERSDAELFVEVVIKRSMFLDHLPSSYEDALQSWLSGDADHLGIDL